MERVTSTQLLASSTRRVTRLQLRIVLSIFPFLCLPAELRNIVYGLCLDFDGLKSFFDKYYHDLYASKHKLVTYPTPRKQLPSIFLLNRQIYVEAASLLRKYSIRFEHGLLRIPSVKELVTSNILKRLSCIEISDDGHPICKTRSLGDSWHGYIRLIKELAWILVDGHSLKKFVISFKDQKLLVHMDQCFGTAAKCGYRDDIRDALNALRLVRGVGTVVLSGINQELATEIKSVMESMPRVHFADLSLGIRNKIWHWALDWSDSHKLYTRAVVNPSTGTRFHTLSTPTALLLNRQYAAEALAVLQTKPLKIEYLSILPTRSAALYQHPMRFVSSRTIQHVTHLQLQFKGLEWLPSLANDVVPALLVQKCLQTLSFHFEDPLKWYTYKIRGEIYPNKSVHKYLKSLQRLRGLQAVEFTGDLPISYTDPLAAIMTSKPWKGEELAKLRACKGLLLIDID